MIDYAFYILRCLSESHNALSRLIDSNSVARVAFLPKYLPTRARQCIPFLFYPYAVNGIVALSWVRALHNCSQFDGKWSHNTLWLVLFQSLKVILLSLFGCFLSLVSTLLPTPASLPHCASTFYAKEYIYNLNQCNSVFCVLMCSDYDLRSLANRNGCWWNRETTSRVMSRPKR